MQIAESLLLECEALFLWSTGGLLEDGQAVALDMYGSAEAF
jgi:hypothetical protein